MCPSIRCSRMSAGRVDAWTLPAPWKLRTPSRVMVTATETFMPSPTYMQNDVRACRSRSGTSLTMPVADLRDQLAVRRPNATTPHGTASRLQASQPATSDRGRQWPPRRARRTARGAGRSSGSSATTAAAAASPISTRSAPAVPIGGNQQQAEHQRADDGADGVGRIDPADQPPGVLAAGRDRRQRQREARSPQARRRQDGPQAAHQVELEM